MSRTEDWSEFVQAPVDNEIVELAGKWKHGWIPLDGAAISSKMKGNTGGKKWWSGDGGNKGRSAIGIPKKGGKPYEKPRGWGRSNELDKMDMPTRDKIAELNKVGKFGEAQKTAIASRASNKKRLAEVDKTRNKMLTTKKVPGAAAKPRDGRAPYQRGKMAPMSAKPEGPDAKDIVKRYVDLYGRRGTQEKLNALKAEPNPTEADRAVISALSAYLSKPSSTKKKPTTGSTSVERYERGLRLR